MRDEVVFRSRQKGTLHRKVNKWVGTCVAQQQRNRQHSGINSEQTCFRRSAYLKNCLPATRTNTLLAYIGARRVTARADLYATRVGSLTDEKTRRSPGYIDGANVQSVLKVSAPA